MPDNKTRTNIYINPEIHETAKALAADERRSLSGLVELLLEQYINEAEANGWVYVEITNPPPRRRVERQGEEDGRNDKTCSVKSPNIPKENR